MTVRDELRELVDQLDGEEATRVLAYVRWLLREQALRQTLANAPGDDEPETEEERAAVAEAKAAIARGEVVRHEDILREFGP